MLKTLNAQDRTIVKGAYTFDEKNHVHTLDGKPLTGVTTILGVIAKPALISWAASEAVKYVSEKATWNDNGTEFQCAAHILEEAKVAHRKKKESAGEFGTNVHNAIEKYVNAKMLDIPFDHKIVDALPDMEAKAVAHFITWAIENKVKFLESEKHVYSRNLWVGGICDIVCEIEGKRYVADIKTSSGVYPEAFIQCSAYAKMLQEMEYTHRINPECTFVRNGYCTLQNCERCNWKFDGVLILNCNKKGGFEHAFNYDIEGNWECFQAAVKIYRQLNAIK